MADRMKLPGMSCGVAVPDGFPFHSFNQKIIDFLDGRNDGGELMLALYGDIADEPLPPRLATLLKHWRAH